MKKEILTFSIIFESYVDISIPKKTVRENIINQLNNDGLIPLNLKINKVDINILTDTSLFKNAPPSGKNIYFIHSLCAKTTRKEARKIKEIKRRINTKEFKFAL